MNLNTTYTEKDKIRNKKALKSKNNVYLNQPEKEKKVKAKVNEREEIINIRAEIINNSIEKAVKKNIKTKVELFEN